MKSLLGFKEWCEIKGHYAALTAVNSYIKVLNERAENSKYDNQEAREGKLHSNQLNNR